MPGFGVLEAQNMGMKGLAIKPGEGIAGCGTEQCRLGLESGPVNPVGEQRMADMGEMDPDLVGAPGFQPAGKQARYGIRSSPEVAFRHLPRGNCLPPAFPYCHSAARVVLSGERLRETT